MSYYDPLETRDPEEREADLMDKLARQVAHAQGDALLFPGAGRGESRRLRRARHWPSCR